MSDRHPAGRPWGPAAHTCADCAWSRLRGPGPRVLRCLPAGDRRVAPETRACDRFEPDLDCLTCGACCREAFDAVEVSRSDPVRQRHPDLLEEADGRLRVRRAPGNRCEALHPVTYQCAIYADRPRCCRDFERLGPNCLFARRRVGRTRSWSGD